MENKGFNIYRYYISDRKTMIIKIYDDEKEIYLRQDKIYNVYIKSSTQKVYTGRFVCEGDEILYFDCSEKYKSNKVKIHIDDIIYIKEVFIYE